MPAFYILVKPWAVYVKTEEFFKQQGGLAEEWGGHWQRIEAESIAAARRFGEAQKVGRVAYAQR